MGLRRLYTLMKDLEYPEERLQSSGSEGLTPERVQETEGIIERFRNNFQEAMEDDFNTAQAIGHMYELARQLNRIMASLRPKELEGLSKPLKQAAELFKQCGQILGILTLPARDFLEQEKRRLLDKRGLSVEEIENLIDERNKARKEKEWAKADALRDRLNEIKVLIKDTPQGTVWQMEE